jgi:uncharacterized protein YcaQ
MTTVTVTLAAIRRLVVSAQGYAPRFRRAQPGDVEEAIRRLSAVQLDSISTVDRAHRLTLTSRTGAYDEPELQGLLTSGRVFEYWAHEACLLPIELWPHFRRTMDGDAHWGFHARALRDHGDLVEPVLERIRTEGPLGSRDFEGAGGKADMWDWKPAKMVLEALWDRGDLAIAGRQSFQRRYDLAERVIPRSILDAPLPEEDETLRTLTLLAVRARGALTEPAITGGSRAAVRAFTTTSSRSSTMASCARCTSTAAGRRSTSAPAWSSTATRHHPSSSAPSTTCSGTGRYSSGCSASGT